MPFFDHQAAPNKLSRQRLCNPVRQSKRVLATLFIQVPLLLLGACSLAPTYHVPQVDIKNDAWQDEIWQQAQPADEQAHGPWWQQYGDSQLNALVHKIDVSNANLAAALARYDVANAYVQKLDADTKPSLDAGAVLTDNRQSKDRPLRGSNQPNVYDANTVGISANYTFDFWGRIRNLVAAGVANAQATAADVETLRLYLQANLVETYINLRAIDDQITLLVDTQNAYTKAFELTQRRHQGGIASGVDVARAATQLHSVEAQLQNVYAKRAIYEHAIASLIGEPAMNFSVPVSQQSLAMPVIPVGLPSTLLQRRADISAAERRVAAANASIGVARAAYYPNLTLTPYYGVQNTGKANLFSAPNTFWSIGPSLLLNLFDGGKHDADLAAAKANFAAASADYRAVVLKAFQEVADNLVQIKFDKSGEIKQKEAVSAAQLTLSLSMNRYREGAVNYLEVVTAQAAALSAQRAALDLHSQQLRTSVELFRALGGDWQAPH